MPMEAPPAPRRERCCARNGDRRALVYRGDAAGRGRPAGAAGPARHPGLAARPAPPSASRRPPLRGIRSAPGPAGRGSAQKSRSA
jgi:hypothetical protein